MRLLSLLALLLFFAVSPATAQTDSVAQAGSQFSTSGGRKFWMGANYRTEWNTPVKAPVINLATEKGGLTPVRRGGGKQTKSLRLEDKNGRQYTIRSIQKFVTAKTLPADLQSQAAVDLVSDGISASYPYASLSVGPIADAAGVPYGKVRLVYVGDDPKLGEFREDFKNMLATFEERLPAGVDKGYDTDEVADKLEEDNDHRVDQKALLRARILDMFVMDLDRHEDQWQWGAVDNANGKGKTFFPIPRDRDQAFYINRGVLPGFIKGRSLVPQLEGFKPEAKSIERFNFAARNLDRFFLTELTEADWKAEVESFKAKMTDEVIDRAIAQQPHEIREISGPWIAQTLKERRNFIVAEVMEYYTFINQFVTVTASDKKELITVTRSSSDGATTVTLQKIDKDGNLAQKMYERTFDPQVTKEIRIFGFGGEDKFVVNGTNDKIKLRLIGGGGQDEFVNNEKNQRGTYIYDRLDGNNTVTGKFKNKMANDTIVNSFNQLGYKYPYQAVFLTLGYNPDDGIFIGPTLKYIRHGFRKEPYKSMHQFKAAYAFSTKALNVFYSGEFMGFFGHNTDLTLDAEYRGPNGTTNFFGYGVNSVYDKTKPGKFRFYRIRYDLGDINLQIRQRFSDKVSISFGPTYQWYQFDSTDNLNKTRNVMLNTVGSGLTPSLFRDQCYWGGKFSLLIDTRNHKVLPERGINWQTSVRSLSGLGSNSYDNVTQLNSDFAVYFPLIADRLTLANRFGGGITFGDGFEFYQAQYLGLEDNLRGYRKQRFAGRSKIYNQAELRLRLSNFRTYIFNGAMGIHAFLDAGRVFMKDDGDDKMFAGYGGGLWFAPLRRLVLTFTYAASKEDKMPLIGLGWKLDK